jgi:putative ABC transport system ATP-binding protein
MPPAIEFRNVSRVYGAAGTRVTALDDLTVAMPAGSFTAVMGPSGSGKSTLLHIAGGLDRATSGQVIVGGRDLTAATEGQLTDLRRSVVGFIFQNFNLIGSLTAEQNVALPSRLAGHRPTSASIRQALSDVGLADRARHKPRELSGGQQQRVAIARALLNRPTVLLADEPTGALDSRSARAVLEMLRALADRRNQTIVIVSHDPKAAAYADEVLFVCDGRIVDSVASPSAALVGERLARLEG